MDGSAAAPALARAADWVETVEVCSELQELGEYGLLVATEHLAKLYIGWRPPSAQQVSSVTSLFIPCSSSFAQCTPSIL